MRNTLLLFMLFLAGLVAAQNAQFDPAGNLVLTGAGAVAPSQLRGPASRLARPGDAVSLSVVTTGPAFSFRWYFNGTLLPGAVTDTLLVTNVSAGEVGNYYVVASNSVTVLTSSVARIDLDSDHDGLGDAWELANFGSLTNQNGNMDSDADGNSNLQEFLDGTNPNNPTDLRTRLSLYAIGGDILVTPNLPSYGTNDVVTLTAVPASGTSFVGWVGDLIGTTNPVTLAMSANRVVQANFGMPLSVALSTTNPVVTGGG